MAKFIFAYHGSPNFKSSEDGSKYHGKFKSWVVGLGAAALEPLNPVGKSKTVCASGVADDGGSNPLGGYTVIDAVDIVEAVKIAQTCPHTEFGSIEIAEIKNVSM